MPPIAVFDTNIWISGLFWRGDSAWCLALARAGNIKLAYSEPMLAELTGKLRVKFGLSENRIQVVTHEYRRLSALVKPTGKLAVVVPDPDDDKFIECAVTAKAEVIVSQDRHLLTLGHYETIDIVRPNEFLARYPFGQR